MWPAAVPTGDDSSLPSPYMPIDEVEKQADRPAAQVAAAAAAAADAADEGEFCGGEVGAW